MKKRAVDGPSFKTVILIALAPTLPHPSLLQMFAS